MPQELSFSLLDWIGLILSKFCFILWLCKAQLPQRTKERLRDRTYIVPGDQWLIFLWKDFKYDEHDAWNGLLRSKLLVKVIVI